MVKYLGLAPRGFARFLPKSMPGLHVEHWIILALLVASWIDSGVIIARLLG